MPQVSIYLDPETDSRLRAAADRAGKSRSKWVAELIRTQTEQSWPAIISELAGSWQEFPSLEELRQRQGEDIPREDL